MASKISSTAQTGFAKADAYDQFRPSYPEESIENLLKNLNVLGVEGAQIVDLAAGTGKFTTLLAARPEKYEIIAVEPHEDMRKVLEAKKLERVTIVSGTAEKMPAVESGWAHAVVVAQAFHWFARMDALQEIHRTLEPGAVLGLIWNLEDYNARLDTEPSTKWEGKMKNIIWTNDDAEPRFRHGDWPKVFDEQLATTPATIQAANPIFSLPLGEHVAKWTNWLTKEQIWSRFSTISHISVLEGARLESARRLAFEAMDGEDVETNEKGEIGLHGQTLSYWTTAIPTEPIKKIT